MFIYVADPVTNREQWVMNLMNRYTPRAAGPNR